MVLQQYVTMDEGTELNYSDADGEEWCVCVCVNEKQRERERDRRAKSQSSSC